jgi:hypothetical protein
VEQIKTDPNFIWGEATAENIFLADQMAIKDLVSQLNTQVESRFTMVLTEDDKGLQEFTESAINTYTTTTLNRAKRKVIEHNNEVYVIRYMQQDDAESLFADRKVKIIDYARLGYKARNQQRIGDALRYYYWSLALLRSHPDANSIRFNIDDSDYALFPWLLDEINALLSSLSFDMIAYKADTTHLMLMLNITSNGVPVQNLDYVFWTGDTYSNLYSCKDGKAVVEYFGDLNMPEFIKMRVEYRYDNKSALDPEVEQVLQSNIIPTIKKSAINIPNPYYDQKNGSEDYISKPVFSNSIDHAENKSVQTVEDLIKKIELADTSLSAYFTDEAYIKFQKIYSYGDAILLLDYDSLVCVNLNEFTEIRSVPMRFSFPNNTSSFIEDVVFVCNRDNLITDVRFALSNRATNDILTKSARFGDDIEKYFLIGFLEKYKTAYALEDIGFINQVFNENALIIVGEVIAESQKPDEFYRGLNEYEVEYQRYSKHEYVSHLEEIFNSNQFVNIQFEENEVRKVNGDDKIYGIQIKQNYYSSRYSDKGYLFLMIDLNDVDKPTIYVRTWQPEKHNKDKIYGLEDFSF